jgi:hypothetical protein
MPVPDFKLKGLVAASTHVREHLSRGIEPEHADAFRRNVRATVAQVEQLCRENGTTPEKLPGPSYRAYLFLKTLDLDHLPTPGAATQLAAPKIRIKNLQTICDWVHTELARLVEQAGPPAYAIAAGDAGVAHVLQIITSNAESIEKICRDYQVNPASLPAQSRHVYQWLRFLSDPDNLASHLATLGQLRQILARPEWANAPALAGRPVSIELFHQSHAYRTNRTAQAILLTLAQGYSGAPREALEALLRDALLGLEPARAQVRAYIQSEDFVEIVAALESLAEPPQDNLRGRHYDLAQVFERVNAAYFSGAMARPILTWSRTLSVRKLGHYKTASDTVMLSTLLDDSRVPPHVIDFVMYHELLHKQLGVRMVNGRRYAHTEEFRAAERRFTDYAGAKAFLNALNVEQRE